MCVLTLMGKNNRYLVGKKSVFWADAISKFDNCRNYKLYIDHDLIHGNRVVVKLLLKVLYRLSILAV